MRSSDGGVQPYDVLVFATGSRPFLPPIDGIEHALVFRRLDDCARILEQARHGRRAIVIGGGLLGLEAARGLFNHGIDVHVVHLAPHLMEAQLDEPGAEVLRLQLTGLGIRVSTSLSTTAIRTDGDRVTGVAFSDGSVLDCDFVVVAAGVRPAADLARRAGLAVCRGIVVDDHLACSGADDVYAIGDCAEHRGRVQGLVAPAWEQARVLAERLTGRNLQASYAGSRVATKLKVAGVDLAVMGLKEPVEEDDEVVSYAEVRRGVYKKLIVRGDRIAGAIVIGDAAAIPRLTQAFHEEAVLPPNRSEVLFPLIGGAPGPPVPAADLPDTAQICDCNAVSKGRIVKAVLAGARGLQGGSRPHARIDRLRIVHARSAEDHRLRVRRRPPLRRCPHAWPWPRLTAARSGCSRAAAAASSTRSFARQEGRRSEPLQSRRSSGPTTWRGSRKGWRTTASTSSSF